MAVPALAYDLYTALDDAACDARVHAAKAKLGKKLVVLGHHYQRAEVYRHADRTGDSLKLARLAVECDAEYIVFCGVHFMAEVADILSRPEQQVILPDLAAGCSMADMANLAKVETAWRELATVLDPDEQVTPITYINSAADLKAFCGRHGGIVCTSTNAPGILTWAFRQRQKVLFFPDQHLGRWTGHKLGLELDEMAVWDYHKPLGGLMPEQIRKAKVLLWNGHCSVHQMFRPEHVDAFRAKYPGAKVICHPECAYAVCLKSDYVGSTEYILDTVHKAEPGSRWLVGTELNLVNRLHEEMKGKGVNVHFMSPMVCMCSTMYRIDPQHFAWTLENLAEGNVVNRITVPEPDAGQAKVALERMLSVSA
ncbi:MAG TPA: quinolinate synthase NadA [Gammaproteobacteria bacterium]|nr:quinolinate synthase NadA [Gammaproteobacteria bacterium]